MQQGGAFSERLIATWKIFRLYYGAESKNRMPLYILPKKISQKDLMTYMRNHMEGTPLDMSKDIGAGPFKCPYRWRPMVWEVDGKTYVHERVTATQQTGFSFVTQSRNMPDEVGGIIWFSVDDASSTVYTPIYSSSRNVPETFAKGNGAMMEWVTMQLLGVQSGIKFCLYRYNIIHPEIENMQDSLEHLYVKRVMEVDRRHWNCCRLTEQNQFYMLPISRLIMQMN